MRASARCLAPSAPSSLFLKLQARADRRRQGALTVGRGDKAYFSSNNVGLLLRASARCFAPSASMSLEDKLRTRSERTRQGVLTVGERCAAAYLSETKTEFCFRSYARSMASPTLSPRLLKLASVWSDLIPQSVVSWDLPCATSSMVFAPSSPMLFRSKLQTRDEWMRQRVLTAGKQA